jgi:monooxygenase
MCSGYYSYEGGYLPEFSGIERFKGYVVHPQKWPENLDYAGKRVVVIGSGATAITMVPALAKSAAHVTMLQRSPSFICVYPSIDPHAAALYRNLPPALASLAMRIKYVLGMMYYYQLCIRRPEKMKQLWLGWERTILGPDYDINKHFTPRYRPCTQRVSLAADGDFFLDIRSGKVAVVTDHIETFTETGIRLKSGEELPADVVVTATGLVVVPLGGASFTVDGRQVVPAETFIYKSTMFSDVPNLALVRGYGNASWTLKADLICQYVCRLLNHMDRKGLRQCTPRNSDPDLGEEPWVEATSGYILRSLPYEPKQGSRRPWRYYHNYLLDLMSLRFGSLRDHVMVFSNPWPKRTT